MTLTLRNMQSNLLGPIRSCTCLLRTGCIACLQASSQQYTCNIDRKWRRPSKNTVLTHIVCTQSHQSHSNTFHAGRLRIHQGRWHPWRPGTFRSRTRGRLQLPPLHPSTSRHGKSGTVVVLSNPCTFRLNIPNMGRHWGQRMRCCIDKMQRHQGLLSEPDSPHKDTPRTALRL